VTDRQFARKRPGLSWHTIAFHTRGLDTWKAVCGRTVLDPIVEVLPWGEPTCNSCLAITTRRDEQAIQRGKPNTDEDTEREDDGSTHDEVVP
jgi:hypothetical protein